jgi:hypothetical protein
MFKLLSRLSGTRKPVASRFASLFLERLEDRLSPVSIGPPAPVPTETITLNVTYLPNQQATFSGQLTSSSGLIANQTINLTGVVNATATTNAQGNYSVTLAVPQLGQENAASTDGLSNTAQYNLAGGSPVISNFRAVSEGGGLWLFSGTVSGAPTQGEVIDFGGIDALTGQSVSVNPDGSFDFYAMVNSGQGGWATAEAVDWWDDTSATAGTLVNC